MIGIHRRARHNTRATSWHVRAVIFLALSICSTGHSQIKLRLPFTVSGASSQPQNTQTNAASFLWTPEAKNLVDANRNQNCATDTIEQYRDETIRTALRGVDARNLNPDRAAAIVDSVCSNDAIYKSLDYWRFVFGGRVRPNGQKPQLPVNRMPPGLMCYADNTAIETFLKQIPMRVMSEFNSGTQRVEGWSFNIDEGWVQSGKSALFMATAQSWSQPCHDWYSQQFFRPIFAEDERSRAAQNKGYAELRSIFTATGLPTNSWLIWQDGPQGDVTQRTPYSDVELMFNELNIAAQERIKPILATLTFRTPTKDEFEKTPDYETRVQQARLAFDAASESTAAKAADAVSDAQAQVINEFLGQPVILDSNYDADAETMNLVIGSPMGPFRIRGQISLPPEEARTVKPALEETHPFVLLGLVEGKFAVTAFALWVGDKVYPGTVIEATRSPILFNAAAANQWPETLAQRSRMTREQQVLRQQAEAANILAEARTNTRLAFALRKAQTGDTRCDAIWGHAISAARQSMPESAWNSVVSQLANAADRVGCPP